MAAIRQAAAAPADRTLAVLRNTVASQQGSRDIRDAALLQLLTDLVEQGWRLEVHGDAIYLTPLPATPAPGEEVSEVKSRLRHALTIGRDAQLADKATRRFIRRMESPTLFGRKRVSVLNLIDDGHELASILADLALLPTEEREARLAQVIRPGVEIATSDHACAYTGLSTLDIWRYFRHTWSLEYRPTPGRTLFLLIRNLARPNAPVMGIAALANAIPQLRVRDAWIGWTTAAVLSRLNSEPSAWSTYREVLLTALASVVESVRADDLLEQCGDATGAELERRLYAIAARAIAARDQALRERQVLIDAGDAVGSMKRLPVHEDGTVNWRAASESPLFVRKRAQTLADALFATRILSALSHEAEEVVRLAANDPETVRALSIGAREIRKIGLASRLLDLNVCGAVPPYRDLLAGKLAALSVASREVAEAYTRRYRKQVSEIASQLAGREIVRSPIICAVTTTSLYGVAASQYNRLKLQVASTDDKTTIEWKDLGLSEGFGTIHLSAQTIRSLRKVSIEATGGRSVNNVFGEGTSPRLRQVREGLEALGISPDAILRHRATRRVYGLELFPGALQALRYNDSPNPAMPRFDDIAAAWRGRWLLNRVGNSEVLHRLGRSGPRTVQEELSPRKGPQLSIFEVPATPLASRHLSHAQAMTGKANVRLVQDLYRSAASCADHHDPQTVELLHISTAVEEFVAEEARSGRAVFVTGNPGDGKTHLLRKLEPELGSADVRVCLDANEQSDESTVALIEESLKSRRGAAVAINQGILLDVLRNARGSAWSETTRLELLQPFEYTVSGRRAVSSSRPDGPVRVVDLNLRNNLGPSVVQKALQRILSLSTPCDVCAEGTCPGGENARRLLTPEVGRRVVALLDAVARTGVHATMRDLHGFLAYLVFGGISCRPGKPSPAAKPYWHLAFDGGIGPLFDAVRGFDPAANPSPRVDDKLWRGADKPGDWLTDAHGAATLGEGLEKRRAHFIDQKRRAFFELREGDKLLSMAGSDVDKLFAQLASGDSAMIRRVVRMLNRSFDKDDENDESLFLWASHRYDARTSRYAAGSLAVPIAHLELAVPTPSTAVRKAFPEYRPNHVILRSTQHVEAALLLDREFVAALVTADKGLPTTLRRGEPAARIGAFYDQLAKVAPRPAIDDQIRIKLVDIDTGKNLHVNVNVSNRRFDHY